MESIVSASVSVWDWCVYVFAHLNHNQFKWLQLCAGHSQSKHQLSHRMRIIKLNLAWIMPWINVLNTWVVGVISWAPWWMRTSMPTISFSTIPIQSKCADEYCGSLVCDGRQWDDQSEQKHTETGLAVKSNLGDLFTNVQGTREGANGDWISSPGSAGTLSSSSYV